MKHLRILCILLSVVVLMFGCAGRAADEAPDQFVIGVSLMTLTNPFFQELGGALKEEAERNGYQVMTTSAEFDVSKQRNQVSDFIVQNVDAIVLTPVDSKAIGTAIKEANEAGIPVFTADIAVLVEDVDVVSHIATDNYQAGRIAAGALVEAIGGRGQIGILDYPEVESVILRTRGFLDELEKRKQEDGVQIEVVARLPTGGIQDRGFRATEDMLQAHPDLDGIFAINDLSALGAVAALEKAGRAGRIKIVSVDGQPEGIQAIDEGKIYADAVQYPSQIGKQTVEVIVRYRNGEEVPEEILIPTELYRQPPLAQQ